MGFVFFIFLCQSGFISFPVDLALVVVVVVVVADVVVVIVVAIVVVVVVVAVLCRCCFCVEIGRENFTPHQVPSLKQVQFLSLNFMPVLNLGRGVVRARSGDARQQQQQQQQLQRKQQQQQQRQQNQQFSYFCLFCFGLFLLPQELVDALPETTRGCCTAMKGTLDSTIFICL